MEQALLRKLQLCQLQIAEEIKRICDKHGIKYALDCGTLLGAIRHKGFIPWDDDMDIAMDRENYEKFLKVAETELGEEYFLQTWETDKYYPYPFAKVRKKGTLFVESSYKKSKMNQGIYVDIFPYDNWPDNIGDQKKLWRKKCFYIAMLMMKCNSVSFKNNKDSFLKVVLKLFMFTAVKFLTLFVKKQTIINKFKKLIDTTNDLPHDKIYAQGVSYKFGYWVVDNDYLDTLIETDFENKPFAISEKYDKYLTDIYGDYMTPPPEKTRALGHYVAKIDFGEN